MKRKDYTQSLPPVYKFIKALSKKEDSNVLLFRNEEQRKSLVLREYSEAQPLYDALLPIKNQNLPEIYESILLEDGHIVLEEHIEGLTVAEVLNNGTYTYRGAKKVLLGVCSALSCIHELGFIHRDIKPENIIIADDGRVVLLDFNASRKATQKKQRDTVVLGTIGYAPPEQFGISSSDARADIYALGVLLNEMLTGAHPSSNLARGKAGKIILKATSIDPDKRYQTLEKFASAL